VHKTNLYSRFTVLPQRQFLFAVTLAVALLPLAAGPALAEGTVDRSIQPVLLSFSQIPDLVGRPLSEVGVFRYDPQTDAFEPIPFQIDERLYHTFNEGVGNEFTELIYDVLGLDDGILDVDDELAVVFGDAGVPDPGNAPWPAGADPHRFAISVTDTRPGSPDGTRWVYLYTGVGLETSPTSYVSWPVSPATAISTDKFALGFTGRWLLTSYRLLPPCGTGVDLIDRFKGRADTTTTIQSEEVWDQASMFLGGIVGPVRAIRYVQGAASGTNTLHWDLVYPSTWVRHIKLRVHPLNSVRLYFDWLPLTNAVFYSPQALTGVPLDGVPDTVASVAPGWNVVASDDGGLAVVFDVPPSPLYSSATSYYRDDRNYDDAVGVLAYPDDDDSAYGNHGFTVSGLIDSVADGIPMNIHVFPLCEQEGDATAGQSFAELDQHPLQSSIVPQDLGDLNITSLELERSSSDIELSWQSVHPLAVYQIFRSEFPDLPPGSWTMLGEVGGTTFTDPGAAALPSVYYYDVRVVQAP